MINFTHKKIARSRTIKISVKQNGEVIVTSPKFTPKIFINQFVKNHQDWIITQQEKIAKQKNRLKDNQNQVLLFGKAFDVKVQLDPTKKIGVTKNESQLLINPIDITKESVQKSIERYLKKKAEMYIIQTLVEIAIKMKITYQNVSFKEQSTRWGSCSSKGNLNFNWRLIHTPQEVINYVIVHELAHRTHMNHSIEFWRLVETFDPEYRIHRGWLKRNGMSLH